ncbi:MAG: MFS transporter [Candidatus Omnitrophica bacterium]|nr:MFS transporter [Candidatus Omnitrophota bacterium]
MKKFTFIILCLEGAVLSFNVAASAAIVPSIAHEFVLSQFIAGKIIWMYMLPYGLAALLYGPLIRAVDARKVELISIFFFSVANLLAGFAANIKTLFLARFLMGFFGASVIPLGLVLIAKHMEPDKRGKFVGIFFGATFVASLAGLFLSGIIYWRLIFILPAIIGFILSIVMFFYLPSFKSDLTKFKVNYLDVLRDKKIFAIFTYIFFISLIYHGVQQWLGVYFSTKFCFGQFLISMLITLTSLSGVFGEVIGGDLADKLGRVKTVDLGIILMILSIFLLIFHLPLFVFAIIMVIWGLGWTFNHAGLSTMLTDLPRDSINEAASLNSSVRFVSGGLGAALSGIILQKSFTFGFIIFCLGLIILLFVSPIKPGRSNE